MLPLLLNAVAEGRLSMQRAVELTHYGPARIMRIRPSEESRVVVDPDARHALQDAELITRCGWTPFEGMMVKGRVRTVYLRGRKAHEDGKGLTPAGSGQPLRLR